MQTRYATALFLAGLFASAPVAAQISGTITDDNPTDSFVVAIPPLATPTDVVTPAGPTGE